MKLHTVEQLSELIHKKPSTIRKDLKRRPQSLPPRHFLPHNRRVLFKDVFAWMENSNNSSTKKPKPKYGM